MQIKEARKPSTMLKLGDVQYEKAFQALKDGLCPWKTKTKSNLIMLYSRPEEPLPQRKVAQNLSRLPKPCACWLRTAETPFQVETNNKGLRPMRFNYDTTTELYI